MGHEQPVLLLDIGELLLDPLRDEVLRVPHARYAPYQVLEVLELLAVPLLEDLLERLLPEPGKYLQHVVAGADPVRVVDELDETGLLVVDDLFEDLKE